MKDGKTLESTFRLVHALKRAIHQQIDALELDVAPMHVRVLKIINGQHSCTAMDIAQILDRDKAQVTRLMSGLIDQGLVEKASNPEDKRSHFLLLSEKGRAVMEKINVVDAAIIDRFRQTLSEAELAQFVQISSKMTQTLETDRSHGQSD